MRPPIPIRSLRRFAPVSYRSKPALRSVSEAPPQPVVVILGIPEYWRFDETGQYHGAQLAGDRLVDGVYVPIPIKELEDSILQGYSATLNLHIRWEAGQLGWHDPATGLHILTYDDQRNRADTAHARADNAEARVRELEEELSRLRNS